MLLSCEQSRVDFTFSPTAPRAGEYVRFTNLTESGEDWLWSFGDLSTSSSKSPLHTYKRAGEYTVTLQVDGKKSKTCRRVVTVYDSVPTFSCADTVFEVYRDYTYKALVYNPYNLPVTYHWSVAGAAEITSDTLSSTCTLHYLAPGEATVHLTLVLDGRTYESSRTYSVSDRPAKALLLRTPEADYRQLLYAPYWTLPRFDASAAAVLDLCQDTLQTYNGHTFRLSELRSLFPDMQGFAIAARKLYFRTGSGLFVSLLDGSHVVAVSAEPASALCIDFADERLYWATPSGTFYMPLIGSDNNHFVSTPTHINPLPGITRIAVDQ